MKLKMEIRNEVLIPKKGEFIYLQIHTEEL